MTLLLYIAIGIFVAILSIIEAWYIIYPDNKNEFWDAVNEAKWGLILDIIIWPIGLYGIIASLFWIDFKKDRDS